jgi:hypothetical protein
MTKLMVTVLFGILQELLTKVNGVKISNMDMGLRNSQMVLAMKDSTRMV